MGILELFIAFVLGGVIALSSSSTSEEFICYCMAAGALYFVINYFCEIRIDRRR